MGNFTYLRDRAGKVHVWNNTSPSEKDPWQRAICGDPGDFNEFIDYNGAITCRRCRQVLGMLTQMSLFK